MITNITVTPLFTRAIRVKGVNNLTQAKIKLEVKIAEIEEINKHPEKCPVCHNKIKDVYFQGYMKEREIEKEALEREVAEAQKMIDESKKTSLELMPELQGKRSLIKALALSSKVKAEDLESLQQKTTQMESEISILSSQIGKNIEDDDYIKSTQHNVSELKTNARRIQRKITKLKQEAAYYDWWRNALGNSGGRVACV